MAEEAAEPVKKTCFVVGPIGPIGSTTRIDADFLLNGIIREALKDSPLKIWRADEDSRPGMITDKVIIDIFESDIVIADLSELNPNVFYEIGIRHSAGKPTIHVAAAKTTLPFDNIGHRVIFYDKSNWRDVLEARQLILSQVKEALAEDFQPTSPVTQALSAKAFRATASSEENAIADLMDRIRRIEKQLPNVDARNSSLGHGEIPSLLSDLEKSLNAEFERKRQLRDLVVRLSKEEDFHINDEMVNNFPELNCSTEDFEIIQEAVKSDRIDFVLNRIRASEIPF